MRDNNFEYKMIWTAKLFSFIIRVSDFYLGLALDYEKKENVVFFWEVENGVIILGNYPEVVLLHIEIYNHIQSKCSDIIGLRALWFP